METETTTKSYRIHDSRVQDFNAKVAEIQKRAQRLNKRNGTDFVFVATETSTESVPRKKFDFVTKKEVETGVVDIFHNYVVSATLPKLKGWVLVAALDRVQVEDGVEILTRVRPGHDLPKHFRDHDGTCAHCHTQRQRKTVYVFKREVVGAQ